MRVSVLMERAVTDAVEIEVESLEQLKDIMEDSSLLHQLIDEQNERWEGVVGECLDVRFENANGKSEYVIEDDKVIEKSFDGMMRQDASKRLKANFIKPS